MTAPRQLSAAPAGMFRDASRENVSLIAAIYKGTYSVGPPYNYTLDLAGIQAPVLVIQGR
jgi:hypothetical protein